MPFTNEIAAGNGAIVRNWLQSENFVTGVSGWRISKNGNAEFSNGTFRGSIESGPLTGQHFIVNNVATGDVVDIYDSSNRLIFSIDENGVLTSYTYSGGPSAGHLQVAGADITFNNNSGFISPNPPSISAPDITSGGQELSLYSGTPDGNVNFPGMLQLFGGTSAGSSEVRVTARGINGDVLQLDTANNNTQLIHVGQYSGTVAGGDGHWVFPHGCAFTPKGVVVTPYAAGGGDGAGYVRLWTNAVDATDCYTIWTDDGGTRTANGATVGVNAIFWG